MTSPPLSDPIKIRIVPTPNPQSMKFFLPKMLIDSGIYLDFERTESVQTPLLPSAIFESLAEVTHVFVMQNFLTLTKNPSADWHELAPKVQSFLKTYLEKERSLDFSGSIGALNQETSSTDSNIPSIPERIAKILDEYVKPAVARDGGAIAFASYEAGLVKVRLRGACSGCPSATITLKSGIERLLKSMIPEVEAVEAIED